MDLSALQPCSQPRPQMRAASSFRPAGEVKWGRVLAEQPAFVKREKLEGARARGVSYEGKALRMLQERFRNIVDRGASLAVSPWLQFEDESGLRWCQPDAVGLYLAENFGVVYEVKYAHCSEAWFQIWKLYVPVLEKIYPGVRWLGCEICKWFEPQNSWPQTPVFTPDPLVLQDKGTSVHIWNPSRNA